MPSWKLNAPGLSALAIIDEVSAAFVRIEMEIDDAISSRSCSDADDKPGDVAEPADAGELKS